MSLAEIASFPIVAVNVGPDFQVVYAGSGPSHHRPLLAFLERALESGELKDSELGPVILETLQQETGLSLDDHFDPKWITVGIRTGDLLFPIICSGAGFRDWQTDFSKMAIPILVGVAKSLKRSPHAQAALVHLCERLADRLRLKVKWPDDLDEANELKNLLYRSCLEATEMEYDDTVLSALHGIRLSGPF